MPNTTAHSALDRIQAYINGQLQQFVLPHEPLLESGRFKAFADFLAVIQLIHSAGLLRSDHDELRTLGLIPSSRTLDHFADEYEQLRYLVLSCCAQLSALGWVEDDDVRPIARRLAIEPELVPFLPVLGDLPAMLVRTSLAHFGLPCNLPPTPDIADICNRPGLVSALLTVNDSAYYYLTHAVFFHTHFGQSKPPALNDERLVQALETVGHMAFLLAHMDVLAEVVVCLLIAGRRERIAQRWLNLIAGNVSKWGFCPDLRYGIRFPVALTDADLFRRSYHCSLTSLSALALYHRLPVHLGSVAVERVPIVEHVEMPHSHYRRLLDHIDRLSNGATKGAAHNADEAALRELLDEISSWGLDIERILTRNLGRTAYRLMADATSWNANHA